MAGTTRTIQAVQTPNVLALNISDSVPVRSFTVGNQSNTTVNVFVGQVAVGPPYYIVPAGANITLPVMATSWVTFQVAGNGGPLLGTVYLHVDSESLTASGFNTNLFQNSVVSPNGYVTFPNGVILQWGSVYINPGNSAGISLLVTFPIPFGVTYFSLLLTVTQYGEGVSGYPAIIASPTTVPAPLSFSCHVSGGDPGAVNGNTLYWMAIGI